MIMTDSGFWLALLNKRDKYHQQANAALKELDEPLMTTWPVVTETTHLLLTRLGSHAQLRFVDNLVKGYVEIFDIGKYHLPRIKTLMKKYDTLPMDLADASLVVAAEELEDGRILSTDLRDFRTYRWKNHQPFSNLLI